MPIRSPCAASGAPGTRPESSIAIRPAARPNWLKRSMDRTARASMKSSGSKSSACAATCERKADGSKRSMRFTGLTPARIPARNGSSPIPTAEITPMPVMTARRGEEAPPGPRMGDEEVMSGLRAGGRSGRAGRLLDGVLGERLGDRPERPEGAARNRAGEEAIDERREARHRGCEEVGDLDAGPSPPVGERRGLDRPGDVHTLRRARHVDEAEPPGRGLVPGPAAPGHRQPEAEDGYERAPGHEVADPDPVGLLADDD